VKYFNGFSLQNEEYLFDAFISKHNTTVVGFSYGAQKAFDYAYHTDKRIDKLILLSPAFFQTQKESFTRTQLRYYDSDKTNYIKHFLLNSTYPSTIDISKYLATGTKEELNSLLQYQWSYDKIQKLLAKNITIEVFLGSEDTIIDSKQAKDFFSITNTYMIKGAGHLLKTSTCKGLV
jgi:pimeloyl-ACP methyl ester carboxylesterase